MRGLSVLPLKLSALPAARSPLRGADRTSSPRCPRPPGSREARPGLRRPHSPRPGRGGPRGGARAALRTARGVYLKLGSRRPLAACLCKPGNTRGDRGGTARELGRGQRRAQDGGRRGRVTPRETRRGRARPSDPDMTGLEQDPEFDFDFLFEFNQSGEAAAAAGGSARDGGGALPGLGAGTGSSSAPCAGPGDATAGERAASGATCGRGRCLARPQGAPGVPRRALGVEGAGGGRPAPSGLFRGEQWPQLRTWTSSSENRWPASLPEGTGKPPSMSRFAARGQSPEEAGPGAAQGVSGWRWFFCCFLPAFTLSSLCQK